MIEGYKSLKSPILLPLFESACWCCGAAVLGTTLHGMSPRLLVWNACSMGPGSMVISEDGGYRPVLIRVVCLMAAQ